MKLDEEYALLQKEYLLCARLEHLPFMSFVWQNSFEDYIIGYHTKVICNAIDRAIERFSKGESSFLQISVPIRHGKSECVSRKLPAHFLGLFPDCKVILSGHTAELTEGFSRQSRDLIGSPAYKELFPAIEIDDTLSQASHWKIKNHNGECFATGLLGSLTGQGGDLLILDDYCSNREDAESATMRNKQWDAFSNNFMTRRAPVSIVIVLATRWHQDDIIGRIKQNMIDDPSYPRFEEINIPAFSDKYPQGVLFPERFPKAWYEEQRATLGEYGTSSLLQGEPVARGGNRFRVDNIQENDMSEFPDAQYWRTFDLSHTKKERDKQDPDYTVGTLLCFVQDENGAWHCWVRDVWRIREEAPERDAGILALSDTDDASVKYGIEYSNDSKDAYKALSRVLDGKRLVFTGRASGDKSVRAMPLEPIIQAGHFHVLRGAPWVRALIDELAAFPSVNHDDQIDTLSAGYHFAVAKPAGFYEDPKTKEYNKALKEKRLLAQRREQWLRTGKPYDAIEIPEIKTIAGLDSYS